MEKFVKENPYFFENNSGYNPPDSARGSANQRQRTTQDDARKKELENKFPALR